jgi:TonB family protein
MQLLSEHISGCSPCGTEYKSYAGTQVLVASLGPKKAPPELALRLRVAVQQERNRRQRRSFAGLRLRVEHALNAFMLPATAGVLSAVITLGTLFGFFATPQIANDVPTMLYTPPKLTAAPALPGVESAVIVEVSIDASGRVQDYRILSGPEDSRALQVQLDNAMLFTRFEPARSFGQPASGKLVISFSNVNVRG